MIHVTFRSLFSRLVFLVAPALLAQGGIMPPPPLLLIVREEVKPGRGGPHAVTETAWTRALTKAKSTDHYLGMTSLTGPSEAWFIMGYANHADWDTKQHELDKDQTFMKEVDKIAQDDGEHLTGTRSILAAFRKDMSYGPDVEIGKMRYFRVRTFRVKQGQAKAFEDGIKLNLAAYGKSNFPGSFAFYEVLAGTGSPTYIVLRPMKSLADLDALASANAAAQEALGEEGRKALQKGSVETLNAVDTQLFSFSPKLSFPGPATIASDPAFWTVKAE